MYVFFLYFPRYARFAPNLPGVMNGKVPTEKGKVRPGSFSGFKPFQATEDTCVAQLPTREQALKSASTARVLSNVDRTEEFLGTISSKMFAETEVWRVYEKFREDLAKVEEEIVERNKNLEIPYTVLQPSKIPSGIAV